MNTLDFWRREIPKRDRERAQQQKKSGGAKPISSPSIFIPVVPKDSESVNNKRSKVMEIVFAGGKYSLRLDMDIDRESLRKIVTALVDIKC